MVDPEFTDSFAHRSYITKVSNREAANPSRDPGRATAIAQASKPGREHRSLAYLDHQGSV